MGSREICYYDDEHMAHIVCSNEFANDNEIVVCGPECRYWDRHVAYIREDAVLIIKDKALTDEERENLEFSMHKYARLTDLLR